MPLCFLWSVIIGLVFLSPCLLAQTPEADLPPFVPTREYLEEATRRLPSSQQGPPPTELSRAKVYKQRIEPHWNPAGTAFWYVNRLARGQAEYILVDTEARTRSPAFDHARLVEGLTAAGVREAQRLDLKDLAFMEGAIEFRIDRQFWRCDLAQYDVTSLTRPAPKIAPLADLPGRSRTTGLETALQFSNRSGGEIELFWLNTEGQPVSYGKLADGQDHSQHTFSGHVWEVRTTVGKNRGRYMADEQGGDIVIGPEMPPESTGPSPPANTPRAERPRRPRFPSQSPDGQWHIEVRNHNLVLIGTDRPEVVLTTDGQDGHSYTLRSLSWSPDSSRLVACRMLPGDKHEVHTLQSSPPEGGRAKLHSYPYPLPGDRFDSYELNLFEVAPQKTQRLALDRFDFGAPEIRWAKDGRHFTCEKVDRGHQRFRLFRVDSHTGEDHTLIDEQSSTFIWTTHHEDRGAELVTWLHQTEELLYSTERSGWRQLELIDAVTGEVKHHVTPSGAVVRGIDWIDEDRRQLWFRASGFHAGQDPYFVHYYRVNFDGTGLVALTDGNGQHSVQFSPDRRFLIDTWSRVDQAPVHELRRTSDGALVCALETADIAELLAAGWEPPEVFVAKGRDGVTDIWGVLYRPRDFDPTKKYPVIEDIYAGPHGAFVPKAFSAGRRQPLTDAGFFIAKIDGMGTALRSKAFHDQCWQNLHDAGFPDRILWHQAVAAKYPQYDISRVGIFGTSAGGQASTGGVLFHPEFYKVAVSSCGCHDNRMDKASWNEQWMGYPVGPHYSNSSNIDNAQRLQGQLMLIVGEMDNNVPPESTLRLADALIRHQKEFELVVIPNLGHSDGGPYGQRKRLNFFVRHLHGVDP